MSFLGVMFAPTEFHQFWWKFDENAFPPHTNHHQCRTCKLSNGVPFESRAVLLKVLLNLQPKLYVLLKYLFGKTLELGSNLADFERGAKFLARFTKKIF
jgi:hypothetical protein